MEEVRKTFLINITIAQMKGEKSNQKCNHFLSPPFDFRSVVLMSGLSLASKQLRMSINYHR